MNGGTGFQIRVFGENVRLSDEPGTFVLVERDGLKRGIGRKGNAVHLGQPPIQENRRAQHHFAIIRGRASRGPIQEEFK